MTIKEIKMSVRARKLLVLLAFILFSVLLVGAFYLFTTPGQTVNLAFAYVVGLSMIVLPCTLPLAFVIVPLAMGKNAKRGLIMALFFGLGLSITISLYGIFVALLGKIIGLDQAIGQASPISRVLFIIGGLAAFIFGLSELGLVKFKLPSYSGSQPGFIQKQSDYLKAFFLGLFLGNAGVGCPNPLFYVLLGDIAVIGSVAHGWWLGFIHGVGRATPLIFLAILAILGVNAVSGVAKKGDLVKKITGWSLIALGAFIFISGTSHNWYETTPVHQGWNRLVEAVAGEQIAEIEEHRDIEGLPAEHQELRVTDLELHKHPEDFPEEHGHIVIKDEGRAEAAEMEDYIPGPWGAPLALLLLIAAPVIWYYLKSRLKNKTKIYKSQSN